MGKLAYEAPPFPSLSLERNCVLFLLCPPRLYLACGLWRKSVLFWNLHNTRLQIKVTRLFADFSSPNEKSLASTRSTQGKWVLGTGPSSNIPTCFCEIILFISVLEIQQLTSLAQDDLSHKRELSLAHSSYDFK